MRNISQSHFFQSQKRCPRKLPRTREFAAALLINDCVSEPCLVRDLNANGAQIRISAWKAIQSEGHLINLKSSLAYQARTIWQSGSLAGLQFHNVFVLDDNLPAEYEFLGYCFQTAKLDQLHKLVLQGMSLGIALHKLDISTERYRLWT